MAAMAETPPTPRLPLPRRLVELPDPTGDDYAPSALPSTTARVLAFVSILVGGLCGGLIGWAFVDLQCTGDCGTVAGAGRPGRRRGRRGRRGRRRRARAAGHGRVAHDPAPPGLDARRRPSGPSGPLVRGVEPTDSAEARARRKPSAWRHARPGRRSRRCGPAAARPPASGSPPRRLSWQATAATFASTASATSTQASGSKRARQQQRRRPGGRARPRGSRAGWPPPGRRRRPPPSPPRGGRGG